MMNPTKPFLAMPRAQARVAGRAYDEATRPGASQIQDLLVDLIGENEAANPETVRATLGRMAGDENFLKLLQGLPAAAAVGGVGTALGSGGDLITGDQNRGNALMDLAGAGIGGYGMHRAGLGGTTKAARTLQVLSGLLAGKVASDATQGIAGGMF